MIFMNDVVSSENHCQIAMIFMSHVVASGNYCQIAPSVTIIIMDGNPYII